MITRCGTAIPFLSQSRILLDIQRFAAKQTVSVSHISSEVVDRFISAFRTARRHSWLPVLVFFVTIQIVPAPLKVIVARRPVRFPSQQVVGVSMRDKYSSTS